MQTHLLERELFIAIWIIIFALLTMYLLGFIKLAHDSDLQYVSVGRLFMAVQWVCLLSIGSQVCGCSLKIINAFLRQCIIANLHME